VRVQHRVPSSYVRPPDPEWAEREEREALAQTDARQQRVEAAERRLARAEARAHRAQERGERKSDVRKLWAIVEVRRQELLDLHREMTFTAAGAQHRGQGSHRAVPSGSAL
jgi:hypothetical protein